MHLDIITPDKKLYSGEVKSISVPGTDGSLGILNRHAPLISSLRNGNREGNRQQTSYPQFRN